MGLTFFSLFALGLQLISGEVCNVPKFPMAMLSNLTALPVTPAVFIRDLHDVRNNHWQQLQALSSRNFLLEQHSSLTLTLSSSNAYSHGKYHRSLADYIHLSVDNSAQYANETLYLFGHNYEGVWERIADAYEYPPYEYAEVAGMKTVGLGGHYSGVSFHLHGPGFSEVVHGRKRWFLFPPALTDAVHLFDPNMTVARWVDEIYPLIARHDDNAANTIESAQTYGTCSGGGEVVKKGLTAADVEKLQEGLWECSVGPGEAIYFPSMWMHATLNLAAYNFFVSVFLDTQLIPEGKADI